MAAPLSQDLRKRLIEAGVLGSSARAAGARFGVSAAAAVNIVRRARETGKHGAGADRGLPQAVACRS